MEFHAGIEGEEEGFSYGRDLGGVGNIYDKYPSAFSTALREVNCLGLDIF